MPLAKEHLRLLKIKLNQSKTFIREQRLPLALRLLEPKQLEQFGLSNDISAMPYVRQAMKEVERELAEL